MRLPLDHKEEEEIQSVPELTVAADGPRTTVPVANPTATSTKEEEAEVPVEKLVKYFSLP